MSYKDEFFGNPVYNDEKTFVSKKAKLTGNVKIEDECMICPFACIRADEGSPFFFGKGSNFQDGVTVHGLLDKFVKGDDGLDYSVWIGSHCSIAHGALVHGPARIGKKTFIGFKTIFHSSEIGRNSFVFIGVNVDSSKIGERVYIGTGSNVVESVLGDHVFVGKGVKIIEVEIPSKKEVSTGSTIYRIDEKLCYISPGTLVSTNYLKNNNIVYSPLNGRAYSANGLIVPQNELIDVLPDVSERSEIKFNAEVVDFNKRLANIMEKRRKAIKNWKKSQK